MGEDCCATQLIDRDGVFNVAGLEHFAKTIKLAECGLSYAVVAVMGPQSSGKSTLLNHLFGTNFREMDALKGRSQTTRGIWIAKCVGIEPCTIAMDLEGTDGRERGEDDTTFEKRSALFALAVSDIVLINLWCHDIGREQAANKPLLKTVFQVMMHLFGPRKSTLLFVIRDKTKTPLEYLEQILREDIQKIWDSVSKPQAHRDTPFSEFFNVEVTALSSYEEKEEEFKGQVQHLRQRFFHSISPGGLAGDRWGVIPASGFSFSVRQIWRVIQENKDLDLPAHKVMVATVRCEELANEKFSRFAFDKSWLELEKAVKLGPVSGFGKKLNSILGEYLSEYDLETMYFDESVQAAKRQQLVSKALHLVHPIYQAMLGHVRSRSLYMFKNSLEQSLRRGEGFAESVHNSTQSSMHEFDQGCADVAIQLADWDPTKVREKLHRDIEMHTASVRNTKLSEMIADYQKQLAEALAEPVEALFDAAGEDTWASIRKLLKHESDVAAARFSSALSGFELDQETSDKMIRNLIQFARNVVEKKARDEASRVLVRMKDRFSVAFSHDNDSMPRIWTGKEDIRAITRGARAAALKLLSVMAALRLDEKTDKIEEILYNSLMDGPNVASVSRERNYTDLLASSTWDDVSLKNTLISPLQCKLIWRQFKMETEHSVTQAISAQAAHKRSNNWLPPTWVIAAMIVLGFNEFMFLLRNPLYLVVFFVIFLLSKALYVQLDIPGAFRNGLLSGILSLSSRFLPTIIDLLNRLVDKGQMPHNPEPCGPVPSLGSQSFRSQTQMQTTVADSVSNLSSVSSYVSASETGIEYSGPLTRRQVGTMGD